jgi:hypothetical protein
MLLWNCKFYLVLLTNDQNHQQTGTDVTHKMTIPTEYQEFSAALEIDFSKTRKRNFGHEKKEKNNFVLHRKREMN